MILLLLLLLLILLLILILYTQICSIVTFQNCELHCSSTLNNNIVTHVHAGTLSNSATTLERVEVFNPVFDLSAIQRLIHKIVAPLNIMLDPNFLDLLSFQDTVDLS